MRFSSSLKENHLFRRLYRRGASSANAFLVIYSRKNGTDRNRLGLTVSAKMGCAVKRNLIRRRLREIFRLNQDKLLQGYDMIVIARVRTPSVPYRKLNGMFLRACGQLGLIKEETV